jgi:hypothetical protein
MEKRLLDNDLLTGIKTEFNYEEDSSGQLSKDKFVISTEQDVTKIIESNKRSANAVDKHQKYGEWSKVASIPLTVYYKLKKDGVLDDQKAMKKWLNDPDNRYFKTRGGRV